MAYQELGLEYRELGLEYRELGLETQELGLETQELGLEYQELEKEQLLMSRQMEQWLKKQWLKDRWMVTSLEKELKEFQKMQAIIQKKKSEEQANPYQSKPKPIISKSVYSLIKIKSSRKT